MQDKLTSARTPQELINAAKAMGYDVTQAEAADVIAKAQETSEAEGRLEDASLAAVSGGTNVTELPEFAKIKAFYMERGINCAISLCLYYYKSDVCYDMVKLIGEQL